MDDQTVIQAKKEWTEPELIVLVRSKPEEAVLMVCKEAGGTTPMGTWTDCWYNSMLTCDALAVS